MTKKVTVLIADYVPLLNKGEEAIVKGIEKMLGGEEFVDIGVFGPVDTVLKRGNITVFPYTWIYGSGYLLRGRRRQLKRVEVALKERFGISGKMKNLTGRRYPELSAFFRRADLVLVGHDGSLCPEHFATIRIARESGKRVGILGAGFSPDLRLKWLFWPLYRRAFARTEFSVLREQTSYNFLVRIGIPPETLRLAPDPAFAMEPAPEEEANVLLNRCDWYRQARRQKKAVVGVTVCEKSIVFNNSFLNVADVEEKRKIHAGFVAEILDTLVRERKAAVIFLPHSIEPGPGNDVQVAKRVRAVMQSPAESHTILEGNYRAGLLKCVIRELDFLIGERTHSLISSVSVATPFVGLTNIYDRRTHDILGSMCQAEEQLLDMNQPDVEVACKKILWAFDRRQEIHQQLEEVSERLNRELASVAQMVRNSISNA